MARSMTFGKQQKERNPLAGSTETTGMLLRDVVIHGRSV